MARRGLESRQHNAAIAMINAHSGTHINISLSQPMPVCVTREILRVTIEYSLVNHIKPLSIQRPRGREGISNGISFLLLQLPGPAHRVPRLSPPRPAGGAAHPPRRWESSSR